MKNYDRIHSMTTDELAEWLSENGIYDNGPWDNWFTDTFCDKCPTVSHPIFNWEACYCEVHDNKCCMLNEEEAPDPKTIISMWLKTEEN